MIPSAVPFSRPPFVTGGMGHAAAIGVDGSNTIGGHCDDELAKCKHSRGLAYSVSERNEEAWAVLTEAKRIYENVNDRAGITNCLFDVGRIYRYDSEKIEEAFQFPLYSRRLTSHLIE